MVSRKNGGNKKVFLFILIILSVGLFSALANAAFNFTGITNNQSGSAISANVSLEIYLQPSLSPAIILSTLSNGTGHFNLTVNDTYSAAAYSFKPVLRNFSSNNYDVAWTGQVLPDLPYSEFSSLGSVNFYLYPGITMNLSVVNATGGPVMFHYQIKDARLGFPLASSWDSAMVQNVTLSFSKTRNYSIMIYPNQSFPLGYELTDLTLNNSYQNSTQNPDHINLVFNTSNTLRRVSGNISINGAVNFTSIAIISYLLEVGNLVALDHPMPYNMSAWQGGTDVFNASDGKFNMTLPGAVMSFKTLLFATAVKNGVYYGAFRNLTLGDSNVEITGFTFNLTPLAGLARNVTLDNSIGGNVSIATAEMTFNITFNGSALSNGNLEVDLDYTSAQTNGYAFTMMDNLNGLAYLPLLNASVKKMNVYTSTAAPKKKSYTANDLASGIVNLNLTAFNPGEIDSAEAAGISSYIQVGFYKSDSTCSVPYPPASCSLLNSTDFDSFNPLTVIIGGGKIDFEMKLSNNNMTVKYIDVDMIASGPPDALFDSAANSSSSGADMDAAWRFGSNGPEIYASVLVGIPYAATVDEAAPFNILLNNLYDENWNKVWNASDNPSGAGYNTVADADYAGYNASWFNNSIGGMACSLTNPLADCYVNTTYNMIWLKIPHFSGIGPNVNSVSSGNVSINTSTVLVSCTYNCTIYINATNSNYTLAQSLQNITINNTENPVVNNLTISWYNGTDFNFNGTNSTKQINYNFTLSNGSSSAIHQYKVYINKSSVVTAYWNFTYNVSGMASLLTLQFNLTCVESWSCGDWGTCSIDSSLQSRTCTESVGCGTTNDRPTLTQSCTPASTDSGGSGTTGSAGGVSAGITGDYEQKTWASINSGETASVEIENGDIGVTEVDFGVSQTVYGAWVKVEKTDSLPSSVSSFSGESYRFLHITTSSTLKEDLLVSPTIKFKVEKTWLAENGLVKNEVALFHYDNNAWSKLTTTVGEDDGISVHYTAATPGFSYFVIGVAASEDVVGEAETVSETEAEVTAETVPEVGAEARAELQETAKSKAWLWISLGILAVIVLVAVYYKLKKKPEPVRPRKLT